MASSPTTRDGQYGIRDTIQYGYNTVFRSIRLLNTAMGDRHGAAELLHGAASKPVGHPYHSISSSQRTMAVLYKAVMPSPESHCVLFTPSTHTPRGNFFPLRRAYWRIWIQYEYNTDTIRFFGQYGPYWPSLATGRVHEEHDGHYSLLIPCATAVSPL